MWSKGNRQIILIGGAPTTGKSTMARRLAKHLNLPWISTDQIRDIMRAVANREDYPKLFTPVGYDAEKFLNEFSAQEISRMEFEQGETAWIGVRKFIEDDFTWAEGFVMEGLNILPHLIAENLKLTTDKIKAVFLIDDDADRIRDVVFKRGLFDDAENYPDYVKEKEVEWVQLFSNKIKEEAKKYNFPVVEIDKKHEDLTKVLDALKLSEQSSEI